ncbi:MAG: hypothetical protein NC417_12275 [Candidatus Gastranaerophilales bacterium]|nr:hypothetical protein [Candidatus Gastranaerophilales bacterium]
MELLKSSASLNEFDYNTASFSLQQQIYKFIGLKFIGFPATVQPFHRAAGKGRARDGAKVIENTFCDGRIGVPMSLMHGNARHWTGIAGVSSPHPTHATESILYNLCSCIPQFLQVSLPVT